MHPLALAGLDVFRAFARLFFWLSVLRCNVYKADGWVAQSVEQRTENPCVGGSIPPPATIQINGFSGLFGGGTKNCQ
jgi:hypothetical protein